MTKVGQGNTFGMYYELRIMYYGQMRQIILAIFVCIILNTFPIIHPSPVSADSKFSTSYDLTYKVAESGVTTVTQNFRLTNKTSEFYPQEYVVRVGKKEIGNVKAYDKTGPLPVDVSGEGDSRVIHVKFNFQAAGIDKTLNWTLSYDTTAVAKKHNQIWEIFIPRPNDQNDIEDYSIGLYVPPSFGTPFIFKPQPQQSDHVWQKNDMTTSGIIASYFLGSGNPNQAYDFQLRYHLHNSRLYPVNTDIALPPDTSSQKIYLQTLIPQPVNVRLDRDGNWLAQYLLGPAANLDVLATGSALVYFQPSPEADKPLNLADYRLPQRYWESANARVASLAKQLTTPEEIYKYVVKNLIYSSERAKNNISRLGASGILINPDQAICLEFTDLFIALARSAGTAAREVNGFALPFDKLHQPTISQNSLHSWPEYFDTASKTWIMVDPTWGNTTGAIDYFHSLDTNHIAFVVKGYDSTVPAPAGTYKTDNRQTNDIEIGYHSGPLDQNQLPNISLRTNIPKTIVSGFPFAGKIYLDNNGPTIYDSNQIRLSSTVTDIQNAVQQTSVVPPFGHLELPFTIAPINWQDSRNDIITVNLSGFSKDYPISIMPVYQNKYIAAVGGLTILGLISIIAQITRSLFWSYKKPKLPDKRH